MEFLIDVRQNFLPFVSISSSTDLTVSDQSSMCSMICNGWRVSFPISWRMASSHLIIPASSKSLKHWKLLFQRCFPSVKFCHQCICTRRAMQLLCALCMCVLTQKLAPKWEHFPHQKEGLFNWSGLSLSKGYHSAHPVYSANEVLNVTYVVRGVQWKRCYANSTLRITFTVQSVQWQPYYRSWELTNTSISRANTQHIMDPYNINTFGNKLKYSTTFYTKNIL